MSWFLFKHKTTTNSRFLSKRISTNTSRDSCWNNE
jgi:hypothetical protein